MIVGYQSKDYLFIKIALVLGASKGIEFRKCIKYDCIFRIILIIFVMTLCRLGYANDVISYNENTIRHSLGFTNPNTLGMHLMILAMDIIYLSKKRVSFINLLISFVLCLVSAYFSGSKTITIILLLMIVLFTIYKIWPRLIEKKIIKQSITYMPFILSLVVVIVMAFYMNGKAFELNDLLSNRLYNIAFYKEKYGLSIFGKYLGDLHVTLDTFYAYLLYRLGIISFLLYTFAFIYLFKMLYKKKNYDLIIIMLCFLIYGLSERIWMYIDYNIFILSFGFIIFNDNSIRTSIKMKNNNYTNEC